MIRASASYTSGWGSFVLLKMYHIRVARGGSLSMLHRLTIQLILSLLIIFSLFLPSTNMSLSKKCNVLFPLVINNSPMNSFPIPNSTYVQISCVKYIPLLCQIWPGFIQKSSLIYQQSLGMIQTCVPIFLKSMYSLGDKIRTTVQLITYTVLQNCLSLFTIHIQNCSIFVHFSSEAELQIFVLRVHFMLDLLSCLNDKQQVCGSMIM